MPPTMFGALADLEVNIDMISTSGIRITCVIDGDACGGRGSRPARRVSYCGEDATWQASA